MLVLFNLLRQNTVHPHPFAVFRSRPRMLAGFALKVFFHISAISEISRPFFNILKFIITMYILCYVITVFN